MLTSSHQRVIGQKHYASAEYWNDQWLKRSADKVSDHAVSAIINLARMRDMSNGLGVEIGGGLNPVMDVLRAIVAPTAAYMSFDLSHEAQRINHEHFDWGTWLTGDVRDGLDADDDSADLVLSSHLIEHLDDPYQLIEEQLRICRPGGIIAIAAPLHMHHHEHRQVFAIGDLVGMLKDYANPVFCYVDNRETEIVVGIIKP